MDSKIAHLKLIQAVVNRMSANSFHLKGWSVVLVSALFALAAAETRIEFVYLAYFPAISFWVLDGYFLRQERLFRALYDSVRVLDDTKIDFSMDNSGQTKRVAPWRHTLFSATLLVFHGTVLAAVLIVMIIALIGE